MNAGVNGPAGARWKAGIRPYHLAMSNEETDFYADLLASDVEDPGFSPDRDMLLAAWRLRQLQREIREGDSNGARNEVRALVPALRSNLEILDGLPHSDLHALRTGKPRDVLVREIEASTRILECGEVSGLPVQTLGQLWDGQGEDVTWLVEGVLPEDGISILVAPPKAGKSTAVRCLAAAVASGSGDWLGLTTGGGPVLHLALEERPHTVVNHYRGIGAPVDGIHVMFAPVPPAGQRNRLLRETVANIRPALVIIDTIGRWSPVEDGNSYSQVTSALSPLLALARDGNCHVLMVHHSRKSGGDHTDAVLGSQSFAASVDTVLKLEIRQGQRVISGVGRDGVDLPATVLEMDNSGLVTALGTKTEVDRDGVAGRIVEHLGEAGECTVQEIAIGLGVRKERIYCALEQLAREGSLLRSGAGRKGSPYRYSKAVPGPEDVGTA